MASVDGETCTITDITERRPDGFAHLSSNLSQLLPRFSHGARIALANLSDQQSAARASCVVSRWLHSWHHACMDHKVQANRKFLDSRQARSVGAIGDDTESVRLR